MIDSKSIGWTIVLLLVAVVSLSAQSVVVEYLEGSVEVRENSSWYALSIGESVANDAVLRLGQGGYAEIADGSGTITLARAGTYELSNIIESAHNNRSVNVRSLMIDRVKQLSGVSSASEQRDTATGGVRGSEAAQGPQVDWAGAESASDLIADAIARLGEEDFEEAYFLFEEAYAIGSDAEANKAHFYMGYSAYLSGRQREAIRALTNAELRPDSDYYADHVLTLAQVYIETFAYQDAVSLLEEYLRAHSPEGSNRQTALLLTGLGYKGMDNTTQARDFLNRARSLDESSGVGRTAQRILQQL